MTHLVKSSVAIAVLMLVASGALGQDRSRGGIKGKVRVETGTPAGVAVVVRQGEREVARGVTDRKGEFLINQLTPGLYGVTLRKPGLSIGSIENIEVKPNKTRSLGDNLVLAIDEGSISFIRGSVFDEEGRSVPNVKIELSRILDDGSVKKIDGRVSNEIGAFVFRLTPEPAKYRLTAKPSGSEPVSKDVEVDGAAVYRVALSIKIPRKQ
jgi:Carboxypeptidase regulatory-like domain